MTLPFTEPFFRDRGIRPYITAEYPVLINYSQGWEGLLRGGEYDECHRFITDGKFQLDRSDDAKVTLRLVSFGAWVTQDEVDGFFARRNLVHASFAHLCALGYLLKNVRKHAPILALHSRAQVMEVRPLGFVPCLSVGSVADGHVCYRRMDIRYLQSQWEPMYVFLGVQETPKISTILEGVPPQAVIPYPNYRAA